jgi:hypothetical protein
MGGYSEGAGGVDGLDGFRVVVIRVWFLHPRPPPVPAFPPHVLKHRQDKGEGWGRAGEGYLVGGVDSADGGDGWRKGA